MTLQLDYTPLREAARGVEDPRILDGRVISSALREQVKAGVAMLGEHSGIQPRLVVVMVGEDPASQIYVRHKIRGCEVTGIASERRILPSATTQDVLHAVLRELSDDPAVHGILLQLPLPPHLDENLALEWIHPDKDVDGFHSANLGRLMSWASELEPCTPRGVMTMMEAYDINPVGARTVVVGRSVVVGRPMAHMLLRAGATVTVCHRHTRDLESEVRRAEILVVATGVPELIKGDWIAPGAQVFDVGISRVDGRLVGDVEFGEAYERAQRITPVPGGVGPMTVATLLENTLRATLRASDLKLANGHITQTPQKELTWHKR
ncbi:MAG: bifunctional methylenetetrahydrofolate dehydrogenase/methenyltetrahydrofolate cyclohydrolase FolD [bacterium]